MKPVAENLLTLVERLESKDKLHGMAAQILLSIEKIEQQQQNILKCAAHENKAVLEALQKGMKENQAIMLSNVEVLKEKMEDVRVRAPSLENPY